MNAMLMLIYAEKNYANDHHKNSVSALFIVLIHCCPQAAGRVELPGVKDNLRQEHEEHKDGRSTIEHDVSPPDQVTDGKGTGHWQKR